MNLMTAEGVPAFPEGYSAFHEYLTYLVERARRSRPRLTVNAIAARLGVSPWTVRVHMSGRRLSAPQRQRQPQREVPVPVPAARQVQDYLEVLPHGGATLEEVVDCYDAWPRRELVFPPPPPHAAASMQEYLQYVLRLNGFLVPEATDAEGRAAAVRDPHRGVAAAAEAFGVDRKLLYACLTEPSIGVRRALRLHEVFLHRAGPWADFAAAFGYLVGAHWTDEGWPDPHGFEAPRDWFEAIRTYLGLDQAPFAELIGVSARTVSDIESGDRISAERIRQLYTAVGVPAHLVIRALRCYADEAAAAEFQRIVTLTDDAVSLGPDSWPDPARFASPHEWLAATMLQSRVAQRELAGVLGVSKSTVSLLLQGERPLNPERLRVACEFLGVPAETMFRCLAVHYRRDLDDRVLDLVSPRLPDADPSELARVIEVVFGGLRDVAVQVDYGTSEVDDDTVEYDTLVDDWLRRSVDFVLAVRERLGAVLDRVLSARRAQGELSGVVCQVVSKAFASARESQIDEVVERLPEPDQAIWLVARAGEQPAEQARVMRAVADGLLKQPANKHLARWLRREVPPLDAECVRRSAEAINTWYERVLGITSPVVQALQAQGGARGSTGAGDVAACAGAHGLPRIRCARAARGRGGAASARQGRAGRARAGHVGGRDQEFEGSACVLRGQ